MIATAATLSTGPANAVANGQPVVVKPTAPVVGETLELAGWGATSHVNAVPGTVLNVGQVAVGSVEASTIGVVFNWTYQQIIFG
jgi:hypothetical protein